MMKGKTTKMKKKGKEAPITSTPIESTQSNPERYSSVSSIEAIPSAKKRLVRLQGLSFDSSNEGLRKERNVPRRTELSKKIPQTSRKWKRLRIAESRDSPVKEPEALLEAREPLEDVQFVDRDRLFFRISDDAKDDMLSINEDNILEVSHHQLLNEAKKTDSHAEALIPPSPTSEGDRELRKSSESLAETEILEEAHLRSNAISQYLFAKLITNELGEESDGQSLTAEPPLVDEEVNAIDDSSTEEEREPSPRESRHSSENRRSHIEELLHQLSEEERERRRIPEPSLVDRWAMRRCRKKTAAEKKRIKRIIGVHPVVRHIGFLTHYRFVSYSSLDEDTSDEEPPPRRIKRTTRNARGPSSAPAPEPPNNSDGGVEGPVPSVSTRKRRAQIRQWFASRTTSDPGSPIVRIKKRRVVPIIEESSSSDAS